MRKIILTEADKKKIISEKEKAILESFAKTFNKIKRIDENEMIEPTMVQHNLDEGIKDWVLGGILALSSIAGFYKLSDNAKNDKNQEIKYVNALNNVVDKLGDDAAVNLATKYNQTDFGTSSNASGHIEPEIGYKDDNGQMVYTNSNEKNVRDNIKREIKTHPENFQISKDGTTIIFVK